MLILGIESSCDETAAAVVKKIDNKVEVLSSNLASSAEIHVKYGGVVPEQAARHQLESIWPVIDEALSQAQIKLEDLDAIAVAPGPGLIGSLLVGTETAKTIALTLNKPLIPVTHLIGHFYANWIEQTPPTFPCIGLLVSGGHTDLVLFEDHGQYQYVGGTRDDAAGECFDKCARLLDLPYPGGPNLSKLAQEGDASKFNLPKPMWNSKDFDFSFSGLKTAVSNVVHDPDWNDSQNADLAAAVEQTICTVLVRKTFDAAMSRGINSIMIAGGVASNQTLRQMMRDEFPGNLYIPQPKYCTDNAAMIATAAAYINEPVPPLEVQANPNLSLAY